VKQEVETFHEFLGVMDHRSMTSRRKRASLKKLVLLLLKAALA
jgi:hypothetical protein